MKRLTSMNTEALKRPAILISLAVVLVAALGWWFGWMSPEGAKLSSVNAQRSSRQTALNSLRETLATSRYDVVLLQKNGAYLKRFAAAVPATPEAQILTTQIFQLASRTVGARHLTALSDNTMAPPGHGQALGQIPISITITGSYRQCMSFLEGIYTLPRLITINSINPAPQAAGSNTQPNLLDVNGVPSTLQVNATAYYSSLIGG